MEEDTFEWNGIPHTWLTYFSKFPSRFKDTNAQACVYLKIRLSRKNAKHCGCSLQVKNLFGLNPRFLISLKFSNFKYMYNCFLELLKECKKDVWCLLMQKFNAKNDFDNDHANWLSRNGKFQTFLLVLIAITQNCVMSIKILRLKIQKIVDIHQLYTNTGIGMYLTDIIDMRIG